jgi:hypothetical protein
MAPAKRPPLQRQTYYYGSKKVQVGDLKGGVRVGFVAIPTRTAAAIGLKLELPKNIPGTTYSIEHGLIFDSHKTTSGQKVKIPICSKVGSKKMTVTFEASKAGGVGVRKRSGLKGAKPKSSTTSNLASIEIGVPAWADVNSTLAFLKNSKAISFSFGGGTPYFVKQAGAK